MIEIIVQRQSIEELAAKANYDSRALAKLCNLSTRQLQREFRRCFGLSPQQWLDEQRLNAAGPLLLSGEPVKKVAYDLGFKQTSHFCRKFKVQHRMTPSEFVSQRGAISVLSLAGNKCRLPITETD